MTTPSNPYSQPAPVPGQYGTSPLPSVEESHRLDDAALDRLAEVHGINVPRAARRDVWRQVCSSCDSDYDYLIPHREGRHRALDAAAALIDQGWTQGTTSLDEFPTVCPTCSGRPPTDPPAAPQASGGVGTIHDGVLHLDYSDETIRHRALELAVHFTHRQNLVDGPKYTIEVAELFRAYLVDGTIPPTE
ncbi:hypothetical protein SEA_ZITCH_67 [Gordonia Phage Zitch]|uniref:Uncharacterized protein n=1 Tax=Gordonia Phage Zitch TaxID=2743909 RepID=A0A7G3V978_9CAUD|nr:hypothetical protein J1774_gp67 [Gordonia Phage Zitch]QKY78512.1 hypothetical protein SEA_ZITCH_67 [Gordonia Phage Zitch]